MSGYVRKTLRLVFDDPELEGLEVRARRLNIGEMLDLTELRNLTGASDATPEVREGLAKVFAVLAGVLTSWNLEEPKDPANPDGPTVPVPLTPEALLALDMGLVLAIINAIQDATTAVPVPLGQGSSAGAQSVEASIPMESLFESQPD